jgi:hypothetical protein
LSFKNSIWIDSPPETPMFTKIRNYFLKFPSNHFLACPKIALEMGRNHKINSFSWLVFYLFSQLLVCFPRLSLFWSILTWAQIA